jgi:hypothetical protein
MSNEEDFDIKDLGECRIYIGVCLEYESKNKMCSFEFSNIIEDIDIDGHYKIPRINFKIGSLGKKIIGSDDWADISHDDKELDKMLNLLKKGYEGKVPIWGMQETERPYNRIPLRGLGGKDLYMKFQIVEREEKKDE